MGVDPHMSTTPEDAERVVVVGLDGSEASYRAFALAAGFASRSGAAVYACLVSSKPASYGWAGDALPVTAAAAALEQLAGELETWVSQELAGLGLRGCLLKAVGSPAAELERLAGRLHADAIVLGRPSHPLLHLSSVPARLVHGARRLVVVVP